MRSIPDFTKPDWHSARSNDRLVHSIREGKGFMPAMKDKLGATDIVKLVSLVRGFRDGKQVVPDVSDHEDDPSKPTVTEKSTASPNPGSLAPRLVSRATSERGDRRSDAARGLFQRLCASCHGTDGHGNALRAQLPWLPDFTSPAWHQRRSDAHLRTSIVEGKGTAMPTFGGKLGDDQVRNLVAYVRSFAPAPTRPIQESSTDFRQRFQRLENEMNDLKREYRALSLR
jgi:mono/diheme cytochrome c family protein